MPLYMQVENHSDSKRFYYSKLKPLVVQSRKMITICTKYGFDITIFTQLTVDKDDTQCKRMRNKVGSDISSPHMNELR